MKTVPLPSGRQIPVLGQGTWGIGNDAARRKAEVAALRLGLDLGMTLIDTAEMYAEGGAEEVIADAIAGRRPDTFIVSKVYPQNATRHGTVEACDHSLRRLKTDHIDLYLLHWRESTPPLAETLEPFSRSSNRGRSWTMESAILIRMTWKRQRRWPEAMRSSSTKSSIT